jgi:two-component system sensor histidine kinase FlrB
MTSLPMPNCWTEPAVAALPAGLSGSVIGQPSLGQPSIEDEQFLLRAFRSFAEAAGSLEHSYGMLRAEVEQLRRELETSHADLAQSVEDNRSMRAYLDRILEGLPCGVIVVSGDDRISRMNPEALRLLAMNQNADGTLPLTSFANLPGAIRQLLECARAQAGEPEIRLSGEGRTMRWLAARHASICDQSENASVFILRDVSEHKHLEEAQAELRREQALAEMSAVLAHEIRNPLGSLELFAGLLAEADLDSECRNWVEHVQAGLRTLAATVNNVLHFHSLPEPERSPVDLGQLLVWARDFFLPLARQSRVAMSLQNRVAGIFLSADRHRLEQVLLNLVLNALRAMPGGGWIELGGHMIDTADGEAVVLVVSDTGPGITPEHLSSVFDAGFSTRAGSPGLGLAVCRKIVAQHGGTITAGSRPGCGTRFTLTFPQESSPTLLSGDHPDVSVCVVRDALANIPYVNASAEGVAE